MANTIIVKKAKGGVQDLLLGKGSIQQDRAGGTYTIDRLDVPVTTDTIVEMQALDILDFTRARVYFTEDTYIDYVYKPGDITGISSDTGTGTWHKLKSEYPINFEGLSAAVTVISAASANYPVNSGVSTLSYHTKAECTALSIAYPDGGGADYVIVASGTGTNDGGSFIDSGSLQLKLNSDISIESFGATRLINASAINRASVFAALSGSSIITNMPELSIDSNIDFQGVDFTGNGCNLIPNGRDLRDVGSFFNIRQDDGRNNALSNMPLDAHAVINTGRRKLVYEEAGALRVVTQGGAGEGGILHEIVTGNVVSPSLPSSSLNGNWDAYRTTRCRGLYTAFAYNHASTETGTWTEYEIPDSFVDSSGSASLVKIKARKSTVSGNTIEFTAQAGRSGKIKIGFLGTGTSPTSQAIKIDGVVSKTINLLNAGLWIVDLETTAGDHTVSVEHDASGGNLYVIGVNVYELYELDSAPNESVFTDVAPYPKGASYIVSEGAHDYAIKSKIDDLWGGSYHGGETQRADPLWTMDGKVIDPTVSGFVGVGSAFSVYQQTQINWSTQSLDLDSFIEFTDNDIVMTVASTGTVRAKTFHAGMCGTSEYYTGLMSNRFIPDVTLTTASQKIGNVNSLTQFNYATGRKVKLKSTIQEFSNSPDYGGATVTYASGLYNKVYFGPVRNSDQEVTDLCWGLTKSFS
jgi:hypothetical protein